MKSLNNISIASTKSDHSASQLIASTNLSACTINQMSVTKITNNSAKTAKNFI